MKMKQRTIYTLIGCVSLIAGVAIGNTFIDSALATDRVQYKVMEGVEEREEFEELLNVMAEEGWTYHSAEMVTTYGFVFYK